VVLVVPSSTQRVPGGTTDPPNRVWSGELLGGDIVTAHFNSATRDPGVTRIDFDLAIIDVLTSAVAYERNSFWSETNVTWVTTIGAQVEAAFELDGGGEPPDSSHGSVEGFFLEILSTVTAFGEQDRQLLVDIERKLDQTPYQLVVTHAAVGSNQEIILQPGVRAVGWRFVSNETGQPVTAGLPPYYYNLGFCTPLTTAGYTPSVRIKFSPQLLSLPPDALAVAFTIRPGLVLEVSEYTIPFSV
jgi:hypothetical protein